VRMARAKKAFIVILGCFCEFIVSNKIVEWNDCYDRRIGRVPVANGRCERGKIGGNKLES
jgi:hypothetical protein